MVYNAKDRKWNYVKLKKLLDHKESSEVLYNKNWSSKETQEMEASRGKQAAHSGEHQTKPLAGEKSHIKILYLLNSNNLVFHT